VGLILTLVFFILTTFIAGTLAYFGYTEQEQLVKDKKSADTEKANANARLEEERARVAVLRIVLGTDNQDDTDNFAGLFNTRIAAIQAEYARIMNKLKERLPDNEFSWDLVEGNPAPKPTNTLPDLVLKFKDDAKKALDAKTQAVTAQTAALGEVDKANQRANAAKKEFDDKVKEVSADLTKAKMEKSTGFTDIEGKIEELSKTLEALKREKRNAEDDRDREIARLKVDMDKKDARIASFEAKVRPPDVDLNTPKGSIVRREKDIVYVDLGSGSTLRPGTTFSIFPAERSGVLSGGNRSPIQIDLAGKVTVLNDKSLGDAPPEMKGAIEVLEIISPSLASARITYELDAVRNPIRIKDSLFNPAWTPGTREHVAIAGMIDLNGDGLDDNNEFVRMLERQGVVIDAIIDLKDRQIKGKGMTLQTSYLILGPDVNYGTGFTGDGDPRAIVRRELIAEMSKMQKQAEDLGIQPMSARRFMALNGIKLPSNPARADYTAGRYLGNPAPMPEKKE